MEQIPGVTVRVNYAGQFLAPHDDGYLGKLKGGKVTIRVEVQPNRPVLGYIMSGDKDIQPAEDIAPKLTPPRKGRVYVVDVNIVESIDRFPTTKYPRNNIRLLEFVDFSLVRLWTVAIVSQWGDFFLTIECPHEGRFYRSGEKVVSPYYEKKRPTLIPHVATLLGRNVERLPSIDQYEAAVEQPLRPDQEKILRHPNLGIVEWWNFAMGTGGIVTARKAARVHWAQIENGRPRLRFLRKGEVVAFRELVAPVQTTRRTTTYELEARGVRIIPEPAFSSIN